MHIKYPNKIPILVELVPEKSQSLQLEKSKYLASKDIALSQILWEIKKYLRSDQKIENHAFFLLTTNGRLPPTTLTLGQVYERYHDEDGFLYLWLSTENTFG